MISCSNCGQQNDDATRFCVRCGAAIAAPGASGPATPYNAPNVADAGAQYPPGNQWATPDPLYRQPGGAQAANWQAMGADKKIVAGICGILIGGLGVHKFILGYNTEGLIMLLATLLTCGLAGIVTGIIGLVEGIIYITKSDEEFVQTYIQNKRGWF